MGEGFGGLFETGNVLERVGVELTALARRGDLEPVRCRDAEIARVVDILLRQSKNNPALIGKAGVGKTAIVEGLAQRVATGDVPPALKDARVLALDHVALLAGTTFRGQYEERIRRLVRELAADPDLILFVDELHNLIGQGTALGAAMDAANMLKPALVRGDLRVIGATTGGEYDKWIRGDPALERRFQPVLVEELDAVQTWEVLVARRPRLERHHAVAITDDALKAAIVLTDRFVPERARPDKAIDVLDEACAHAQATATVSPELDRLIRERRKVDAMLRRGRPSEQPAEAPADDLVGEIFPMLDRIGAEIEKMLGGEAQRSTRPPATATASRPTAPTLAERRAELDRLLRDELERQDIVVRGADVARVVATAVGKGIEWQP
ncbi:MAG TPA: AAA family ATPase [Gemmatimonadales bacterium]|nr:AAA family ATPase [Gemmatimonadales bacterium]